MIVEYEQYLEEISRLNLDIPEKGVCQASRLLRQDLRVPATEAQIEQARRYLHSPEKRLLEKSLAFVAAYILQGRLVMSLATWGIDMIDREDGGYFEQKIGIFCGDEDLEFWQTKVRTMRRGAEEMRESPFSHATFLAGREDNLQLDDRILEGKLPRFLRRSGLDELPQVLDVLRDKKHLIGIRALTKPELEGTKILWHLRNHPDISLSDKAREVLETYPQRVKTHQPQPAIFSMLSAFKSKDTPHMLRLMLDLEYLSRANLLADLSIFSVTLFSRTLKGGGVR